ncbi:MAG: DMT family transporter [Gemmatimonadota bacterium]
MLRSRKHLALALLIVGIYAFCFSAIKVGLTFAPPLRFAALRSALAGGVLLAVVAGSGRGVLPDRRLWSGTLALALLGTSIGYAAMFMSPGRTGAGISSVLGNTGPIIVIVLAAAFLGEPITRPKVWALLLGTIGVFLIAFPAIADPARAGAVGFLLPLTSAASLSGATVLLKRLEVGDSLVQVAGWQLVIGALPLAIAAAVFERQAAIVWGAPFIAILLFLALVGTAFALWAWYWLVQREDVGRLSLLFFLIPVLGLALAGWLFGEQIGPVEAGGVALTLAGIAVVLRAT